MTERMNIPLTMPVIKSKTFRYLEDANKFADEVSGVVSVRSLLCGISEYVVRWRE